MRNEFIKLVEECGDACLQAHIPLTSERIADHLIASGAILSPVAAGQTVYHFCQEFGAVMPYMVQNIHIGFLGKDKAYWSFEATCHSEEDDEFLDDLEFDNDDIGKTVFLSAEKARESDNG